MVRALFNHKEFEQVKMPARYSQQERYLRQILEHVSDAVVATDVDGRVTSSYSWPTGSSTATADAYLERIMELFTEPVRCRGGAAHAVGVASVSPIPHSMALPTGSSVAPTVPCMTPSAQPRWPRPTARPDVHPRRVFFPLVPYRTPGGVTRHVLASRSDFSA